MVPVQAHVYLLTLGADLFSAGWTGPHVGPPAPKIEIEVEEEIGPRFFGTLGIYECLTPTLSLLWLRSPPFSSYLTPVKLYNYFIPYIT